MSLIQNNYTTQNSQKIYMELSKREPGTAQECQVPRFKR